MGLHRRRSDSRRADAGCSGEDYASARYYNNNFGRFWSPDPSGRANPRTLVPAKSDFAGQPVVQTGAVTINERQGIITVSRNFAYEGATETFFYRDITDADDNATIHTGKDLKSKTSWDHDVLKVTTTQYGAITLERYTLTPDGTMMVSVVRPDHKPITLVFQRK